MTGHPLKPHRRNAFPGDAVLIANCSAGGIKTGEEFTPLSFDADGYTVIRQRDGEKITIRDDES